MTALKASTFVHDEIAKQATVQNALGIGDVSTAALKASTFAHDEIAKQATVQNVLGIGDVSMAALKASTFAHDEIAKQATVQNMLASLYSNQLILDDVARQLGTPGHITDLFGVPSIAANPFLRVLPSFESPEVAKVREEVSELRKKLRSALSQIEAKDKTTQQREGELEALRKMYEELEQKNSLSYLLDRLDPKAHPALLRDERFKSQFSDGSTIKAYVISVDIRRSTELMLKASSAEAFAKFISRVSTALSTIIKANLGVVDKFTGDGILGFFPTEYSGADAGARAIKAAGECHSAFRKLYESSFDAFDTVLLDIGLGIGIDYGDVHLMRVTEGLTVVGRPVVYACRLSGAPAGSTFINESARTALTAAYPKAIRFDRKEHEVKHEGLISVSEITHFEMPTQKEPKWLNAESETKQANEDSEISPPS